MSWWKLRQPDSFKSMRYITFSFVLVGSSHSVCHFDVVSKFSTRGCTCEPRYLWYRWEMANEIGEQNLHRWPWPRHPGINRPAWVLLTHSVLWSPMFVQSGTKLTSWSARHIIYGIGIFLLDLSARWEPTRAELMTPRLEAQEWTPWLE